MGTGYYFDMGHFLLLCNWIALDFKSPQPKTKSHQSDPTQEELPQEFWALGAVALAHHSTTHISMFFVGQLTTVAPMHCC